ncbi:lysozyme inhibitor LprI family protein [Variovorax rhizosphaerae]|uniref:Lysozyme inhibitor LprI family protein n=1 Tax=Variovorax rhizosphaerae TaxID=1836200 RepID=A0ABU8WSE5_9BURK
MKSTLETQVKEWASVAGGGMCNKISNFKTIRFEAGKASRNSAEELPSPVDAGYGEYSYDCYIEGIGTRSGQTAAAFLLAHNGKLSGWIGDEGRAKASAQWSRFVSDGAHATKPAAVSSPEPAPTVVATPAQVDAPSIAKAPVASEVAPQTVSQRSAAEEKVAAPLDSIVRSEPSQASPSFPCDGKLTKHESMICSSPALAAADSELARAYGRALAQASNPEELRAEQRTWRRRRDLCGDAACIEESYSLRIGALRSM